MTVSGALRKTLLLWGIALGCGIWVSRALTDSGGELLVGFIFANLGAFVFAALTCFYRRGAIFTGPLFAMFEGGIFGIVVVECDRWVEGTSCWLLGMSCVGLAVTLGLYGLGLRRLGIPVVFLMALGIAASGVCLVGRLIDGGGTGKVLGFWLEPVIKGVLGGVVGSGIAANLVLDLAAIENGVESGAPKHMEWYSAFSVLVSILWLFVDLFRLVAGMGARVGKFLRGS